MGVNNTLLSAILRQSGGAPVPPAFPDELWGGLPSNTPTLEYWGGLPSDEPTLEIWGGNP